MKDWKSRLRGRNMDPMLKQMINEVVMSITRFPRGFNAQEFSVRLAFPNESPKSVTIKSENGHAVEESCTCADYKRDGDCDHISFAMITLMA